MKYEYKYVRPQYSWFSKEPKAYHKIIEDHAEDGWRLVQIFTPGTGPAGAAAYFELIFEREKP